MPIGIASGYPKASVPWNDLTRNQTDYIDDQYLPFGFKLDKEPSKMNKQEVERLLTWWYKRERNSRVPVAFQFKGYKDQRSGEVVDAREKEKTGGRAANRGRKNGKQVAKGKRVARSDSASDSASASDSDPTVESPLPSKMVQGSSKLPANKLTAQKANIAVDSNSNSTDGGRKRKAAARTDEDSDQSDADKSNAKVNASLAKKQKLDIARQRANEVAKERQKRTDVEADEDKEGEREGRKRKGPPGVRVTEQETTVGRTRSETGQRQLYIPVKTRAAAQREATKRSAK